MRRCEHLNDVHGSIFIRKRRLQFLCVLVHVKAWLNMNKRHSDHRRSELSHAVFLVTSFIVDHSVLEGLTEVRADDAARPRMFRANLSLQRVLATICTRLRVHRLYVRNKVTLVALFPRWCPRARDALPTRPRTTNYRTFDGMSATCMDIFRVITKNLRYITGC